jgi:hypothetical protein
MNLFAAITNGQYEPPSGNKLQLMSLGRAVQPRLLP